MKKILIIEDDEVLRENVAEILELAKYNVFRAGDGKKGVEEALKVKPDIILCDVEMPVLDGYGVLHVLSRHPETFAIPFIFLTGHHELCDLRKGMGMGADDYLTKPINETDLLHSLEIRLQKTESIKRNVIPNRTELFELIEVNYLENFNLVSGIRDTNQYKKKHILYTEGQRPMHVYFIISGKIKEYKVNDEGKELITNIYTKGDFFGYISVLDGVNYTETVQVLDDCELMLIPKIDFMHLISNDKLIARQFINLLSHHVKEKEDQLLNLAYNSLRKKVANGIIVVIDKFKDEKFGKPVIEISREDLANIVGSAQESMIRTLKEFKTEKLIDIIDGSIVVLNECKLRHLSY